MDERMSDIAAGLARRIAVVPPAGPDADIAASRLEDCLAGEGGAALAALFTEVPLARDFVLAVASNSAYLREAAFRDAGRLCRVLASPPDAVVDALIATLVPLTSDEAELKRRLRRVKAEAALAIAFADLAGLWELMTVTGALTRLADACLMAAVRFLLADAHAAGKLALPDVAAPEIGSGWIVLAMGKQGGGELNFSSDIDLVIFYDPAAPALAGREDLSSLFVRMTRRLVGLIEERTADGYVFRTDLRLRPDPGATPVAMSVEGALLYYESTGQNWERAAMIKARPAAGDIAAGNHFLAQLKPYVWRKYLDFAAIRDIQSIKRQIHAHKGFDKVAVAGHNVKLGRGGIREIEFFVQTQQLIAGGRNPGLRGRGTLAMLDALVGQGWLEPETRDRLKAAYVFLRRVEHRIQMLNDEQTHILPETDEGIARVAHLDGYADAATFGEDLRGQLSFVSATYHDLFEDEHDLTFERGNMVFTGTEYDPGTVDTLSRMNFQRPDAVIDIVRQWHFGRYPAMRSSRARELLTELIPRLLAALSSTDAPDQALAAFDGFLNRLPAGVQLFSMLAANSTLIDLVAVILGDSPRMSEVLSRRPHVVDALIEPRFFTTLPDRRTLETRLDASLSEAAGYEDVLDRTRIFCEEQKFMLGVRVITGTASARQLGHNFALLADVLLERIGTATVAELERQHGRVAGGRLALLALGKLGSGEMTASSDLDLILLYDHDPEATASDGRRSLAPSQYYARLTQRLVAAITAPTAEGSLYEVDFRLRPSGNAGPLATRLDAFTRYQHEDAWTWEHMALTRARVVWSTGGLGEAAQSVIDDVLSAERDPDVIRADVADMRARIEQQKRTADPWQLKQVPGGLIDLEFIAQMLRLIHGHDHPALRLRGTEAILVAAADEGLLSPAHRDTLLPAIRLFSDLTQMIRVTVGGHAKFADAPKGVHELICRVASAPSLGQLEAQLRDMQLAVREAFGDLVGPVVRREV